MISKEETDTKLQRYMDELVQSLIEKNLVDENPRISDIQYLKKINKVLLGQTMGYSLMNFASEFMGQNLIMDF